MILQPQIYMYPSLDIVQYAANLSIPITRIATTNITQGVVSLIFQVCPHTMMCHYDNQVLAV